MLTVNFSDAIPEQDRERIKSYYEKKLNPFFADHPQSSVEITHDGTQWNIKSDQELPVIIEYFSRP